MRVLHWDGHELRFKRSYPRPGSRIDDRGSRIASDPGALPAALGKHAEKLALIKHAGVRTIELGACSGAGSMLWENDFTARLSLFRKGGLRGIFLARAWTEVKDEME